MKITWVGFAFVLGLSAPLFADTAVIDATGSEATVVTPANTSESSLIILPVTSVKSESAHAAISIPVAMPVNSRKNLNTVAWKELSGSVQSVDRANLAMTVQDREGKDIFLTMNDRVRIYKNGMQVAYADVEPNDRIKLRYNAE